MKHLFIVWLDIFFISHVGTGFVSIDKLVYSIVGDAFRERIGYPLKRLESFQEVINS